jgi:hypothetical protein
MSAPLMGEWYTTQVNGESGWVCEVIDKPNGNKVLRLRKTDLSTRWTTWVPARESEGKWTQMELPIMNSSYSLA